jgi:hypothetical protein
MTWERIDSFLYLPLYDILFRSIWRYIAEPILGLVRYLPTHKYRRFLRYTRFMRKFSWGVIEKSTAKGDGNDIMSLLLRANVSEDPKIKLTNEEVMGQIKYAACGHHLRTVNEKSSFAVPSSSPDMTQQQTPYPGTFGNLQNTLTRRSAFESRSLLHA